jgi:hypothetical protein
MTAPVSLNDLLDELNLLRDDATCYLNTHTGEIYTITSEERRLLDLIDDPDYVSEDEAEDLEKVHQVTHSSDFVALPDRAEFDEAMTVDAFCDYLGNKKQCQALKQSLDGGGNLERSLQELDMTEQWYEFKDETLARITRKWLDDKKVPYTEDG